MGTGAPKTELRPGPSLEGHRVQWLAERHEPAETERSPGSAAVETQALCPPQGLGKCHGEDDAGAQRPQKDQPRAEKQEAQHEETEGHRQHRAREETPGSGMVIVEGVPYSPL